MPNSIRGTWIFGLSLLLAVATGCSGETKIGAIVSETGALAPYGQQVRRGIELALDEVNAAGGIDGKPIQILFRDDRSSAETGKAVTQELIEIEQVPAIIGAVSSPVTLAIAPLCESSEVVLLSPSSSAPKISHAGEYIFRNYPSDVLEGRALAEFARDIGLHRIAVVAVDSEYGAGLQEVFAQRFESKSRTIVGTYTFPAGDRSSFPTIVAGIAELAPEGIYLPAYVGDLAELLKQVKAAEIQAVILGTSAVTDALIQLAGAATENLVFPRPSFDLDSSEKSVADFVEAFRKRYEQSPDIFAAHGYDATKLIYRAMIATGKTTSEEIRRGLIGIDGYEGAAGRTTFDELGDVVRYPRLFIIRQGRPISYEQFEQEFGTPDLDDLR